jgi:hypothetical protein
VFIVSGICSCEPRELFVGWPEKFDREADFGSAVLEATPAVGISCDARRRREDVLECDAIESESSREVPAEKREDIFFAPLVNGAAMVAAMQRLPLLFIKGASVCSSAAHLLVLNGTE